LLFKAIAGVHDPRDSEARPVALEATFAHYINVGAWDGFNPGGGLSLDGGRCFSAHSRPTSSGSNGENNDDDDHNDVDGYGKEHASVNFASPGLVDRDGDRDHGFLLDSGGGPDVLLGSGCQVIGSRPISGGGLSLDGECELKTIRPISSPGDDDEEHAAAAALVAAATVRSITGFTVYGLGCRV
jgi:hypothetical protein